MSGAFIGTIVGLAFAAVEYVIFGRLIERERRRDGKGSGPKILDLVRKAQLILFPLIGYFAGSLLLDNGGAP